MKRIYCLILAGIGTMLLAACSSESSSAPADPPRTERALPVQVWEVEPLDLSRVADISGTIEPLRTIRLAARTDGVLTEVLVEEGDPVSQGQTLARIDVREQEAELARARANLHERQANFRRIEQLRDRDYVDAASFESAQAELEVAESEVRLWQTRADFGTVESSISGTVVTRHVEPGEAITRHEPLFSLADLSSLVVRLGVSELDVRNLQTGDHVPLRVDAVVDANPLPGTIRRIFPAAEADSRLITVEVEIDDAGRFGVRPGYLARARLLVDQRQDVLAVPIASVAEADDTHYVMVVNAEERLERRAIEAGIIRGTWREVLAGLEPGDRVVAANPREMNEGDKVRIVDLVG